MSFTTLTKKHFLVYWRANYPNGFVGTFTQLLFVSLGVKFLMGSQIQFLYLLFIICSTFASQVVAAAQDERDKGLGDFVTAQGARSFAAYASLFVFSIPIAIYSVLTTLVFYLLPVRSLLGALQQSPELTSDDIPKLVVAATMVVCLIPLALGLSLLLRLINIRSSVPQLVLNLLTMLCMGFSTMKSYFGLGYTIFQWTIPQWIGMNYQHLDMVPLRFAVSLLLNYLIYAYADHVIPRGDEIKQPWYYIFQATYWFPQYFKKPASMVAAPSQDDDVKVEEYTPEQMRHLEKGDCVSISNLRKYFDSPSGPVKALDGLSLAMFPSEIISLLGHNGAGKTTLQGVLTGKLAMTGGSATVFGYDLESELAAVLAETGMCMQEDALWDSLTVMDHMSIVGGLRRIDKVTRRARTVDLLELLGLQAKMNVKVSALSGGMKRRLSLALAFISDPRLLLLDEPSSGVDPVTRRSLWTFLQSKRADKVICISTHFMDEAEVLGDRIAIMAAGRLKSYGTSIFLKDAYGIGYDLIFSKKVAGVDELADNKIFDKVKETIDTAQLTYSEKETLVIQVPLSAAKGFEKLMNVFDEQKTTYGIRGYSVSTSKLEDVYIRVSSAGHSLSKQVKDGLKLSTLQINRSFYNHMAAHFSLRLYDGASAAVGWTIFILLLLYAFWQSNYASGVAFYLYKSSESLENFRLCLFYITIVWRFLFVIAIILSLSSIAGSAGKRLIAEADNGMKEHLIGSGCRRWVYWASVFLQGIARSLPIVLPMLAFLLYTIPESKVNPSSTGALMLTVSTRTQNGIVQTTVGNHFFETFLRVFKLLPQFKDVINTPQQVYDLFSRSQSASRFVGFNPVGYDLVQSIVASPLLNQVQARLFFNVAEILAANIVPLGAALTVENAREISSIALDMCEFSSSSFFNKGHVMFAILSYVIFLVQLSMLKMIMPKWARVFQDVIINAITIPVFFAVIILAIKAPLDPMPGVVKLLLGPFRQSLILFGLFWLVLAVLMLALQLFIDSPKDFFKSSDEDQPVDSSSSTPPELQLINISKKFGEFQAVKQLSLTVGGGEVFGLLGVNGAGKTTSIKIALGLQQSDTGSVIIGGFSLNKQRSKCMERIGYCSQDDILFPDYTVRANVAIFGRNRGVTASQIYDHVSLILDELDLRKIENRKASALSGGNKRRLCVAMAIVGGPVLSILDEPSTGLDPLARRRLWGAVKQLVSSPGRSVLLTTHLMEEADALSHRLGIMVAGEIKVVGTPQQLKDDLGDVFDVSMVVPQRSENEIIDMAVSFKQMTDETSQLLDLAMLSFEDAESIIQAKYSEVVLHAYRKDFDSADEVHPLKLAEWLMKILDMEKLKTWVRDSFIGKRTLVNESGGMLRYEVTNFGKVVDLFRVLEKAKREDMLAQYSIAQPSLDNVFAKVSQQS